VTFVRLYQRFQRQPLSSPYERELGIGGQLRRQLVLDSGRKAVDPMAECR